MTIEEKREKNRIKNVLWRQKNRARYNQLVNVWRTNNRDKTQAYKLKVKYGISIENYNVLLKSQSNKCAICGNEEIAKHNFTKNTQRLAVDHCHKTGKLRELLCQNCNRGLGKFEDDPVRLEAAAAYVRKHSQCEFNP